MYIFNNDNSNTRTHNSNQCVQSLQRMQRPFPSPTLFSLSFGLFISFSISYLSFSIISSIFIFYYFLIFHFRLFVQRTQRPLPSPTLGGIHTYIYIYIHMKAAGSPCFFSSFFWYISIIYIYIYTL